jgi:predicted AAA+ superfamily ATPase
MYLKRHAEESILKLAKMFGAVLVTGPRQVGKTTLLGKVALGFKYVTLDDKLILANAKTDSMAFFKDNKPPIFVDEIQYAPELFPQIKLFIDQSKKKGQFYLTGSQRFEMMKNVTESLAGRLGILTLHGLSLRERFGANCSEPFLPTDDYFAKRGGAGDDIAYDAVWEAIHRGAMPELALNDDFDWEMFYSSYVKTYIERDVSQLIQVGDEIKFINFLTVAASRTGQLLNLSSMSRDIGVSQPTVDRWLSVLVNSGIVHLLRPFHPNFTKRTVKTPKLYFLDTGLAAYLTRWNTVDSLKNGAMAGAFFESFVISEIIKSYYNNGKLDLPIYFYRDSDMNEIDLIIESNSTLYPIEIKKRIEVNVSDIKNFHLIDKISNYKRGQGGVICFYNNLISLQGNDYIIPINYL